MSSRPPTTPGAPPSPPDDGSGSKQLGSGTNPASMGRMASREPGWIRKLLPFLLRHKPSLGLTFFAALSGMLAQALSPLVMRMIVDDAIFSSRRPLAPLLAMLVGLGVFRFAIGFVRRYFGSKVGVAVDFDLRNAIYEHL